MTKMEQEIRATLLQALRLEVSWGYWEYPPDEAEQEAQEKAAYLAAFDTMDVHLSLDSSKVMVTLTWPDELPWDKTEVWNGEHGFWAYDDGRISVIMLEEEFRNVMDRLPALRKHMEERGVTIL